MATLNVSHLMTDTTFADTVSLVTRTSTLTKGVNSLAETTVSGLLMVVQPASGFDLEKVPESARGHENLAFFYSGTLSSQRQNGYSDIIIHQGKRYEVQFVESWGHYGTGYCKAIATRQQVGNG